MIAALALAAIAAQAAEPGPPSPWSLVVARAVWQGDPESLPCDPGDICLDGLFRARFDHARTIIGPKVPRSFEGKAVQHTRFARKPYLLLMLRQLPSGDWNVFTQLFPDRDGWACIAHDYTRYRLPPLPARADVEDRPDELCVRIR